MKNYEANVQKIADKEEYSIPPTTDDPKIIDEIKESLKLNKIL